MKEEWVVEIPIELLAKHDVLCALAYSCPIIFKVKIGSYAYEYDWLRRYKSWFIALASSNLPSPKSLAVQVYKTPIGLLCSDYSSIIAFDILAPDDNPIIVEKDAERLEEAREFIYGFMAGSSSTCIGEEILRELSGIFNHFRHERAYDQYFHVYVAEGNQIARIINGKLEIIAPENSPLYIRTLEYVSAAAYWDAVNGGDLWCAPPMLQVASEMREKLAELGFKFNLPHFKEVHSEGSGSAT